MQTCQLPSTSRLKGPAHTCKKSRGKLTETRDFLLPACSDMVGCFLCFFLRTSNSIRKEGNLLKMMHLTIDCSLRPFLSAWSDLLIMFFKMCCIIFLLGLNLKCKRKLKKFIKIRNKSNKKKNPVFFCPADH